MKRYDYEGLRGAGAIDKINYFTNSMVDDEGFGIIDRKVSNDPDRAIAYTVDRGQAELIVAALNAWEERKCS